MPKQIELFSGSINLCDALASERNILVQHQHYKDMIWLCGRAYEKRTELERLVAFHIGVDVARVQTGRPTDWRRGTFNLAIPMLVFHSDACETEAYRVLLRVPMPFKCSEAENPGSVLEKLRCETASYVWMQQHCADIRIPHLYGFGFPNGLQFSSFHGLSIIPRVILYARQYIASWLGFPILSNYLPVSAPKMPLETGYMIIEYFDESFGKQLPLAARSARILDHPDKMRNLFRGLSRIILSLARVPQPRMGAFRFYDDGTIRLDGRPVSSSVGILESEGAPRTIPVDKTYTNVDEYVADLSTFYETQFHAAPHAAMNAEDCEFQMSTMVFLRSVARHFIEPSHRNGPFFLHMSDGNAGNVMVDDEWNVTGIFDLEWIFSAPPDMFSPPMWLTWASIDDVVSSGYSDYDKVRQAFTNVFEEHEHCMALEGQGTCLSAAMKANWSSGRVWYYLSLLTINAMTHIADARLMPAFVPKEVPHTHWSWLWHRKAQEVITQKVHDRQVYEADVRRLF